MRLMFVLVSIILIIFPFVAGADTTDLEIDVFLSDDNFEYGENVSFSVKVYNPTESDITMEFRSSIQIDYMIDSYRYSDNHDFTDALTYATIPARGSYKWEFVHTPEDFELRSGWHGLVVQLLGTELYAKTEFIVRERVQYLPEGIVLSVDTSKDIYDPGEAPEFTVMARNITDSDISIMIDPANPLRYYILSSDEIKYVDPVVFDNREDAGTVIIGSSEAVDDFMRPEPIEAIVPASDALTWNGRIMEERLLLGGVYTLSAGLYGYGDEVSCEFSVNRVLINGTISGTVMTYAKDSRTMLPLGSATVDLWQYSSDSAAPEISITKFPESLHWTAVTDENGYFIMNDVPVGYYYNLTIAKNGYNPYCQSFITYHQATTLQPVLKPLDIHTDNPLNFKKSTVGDLVIVMGTGWSVFAPESDFKASLSLTNTGHETIYFSFDSGAFVNWSIRDKEGNVVWKATQSDATLLDSSEVDWKIEIAPGKTREFYCIDIISNMLPGHLGKYEFHAELAFTASSDDRLAPGDIGDSVTFVVDTVIGHEVDVKPVDKEYIVDLVDLLKAEFKIEMKDDAVRGEMCITELSENHHKTLENYHFIKMIKIDADYSIRSGMNRATVRIYFEPGDYENPETLVIAHWKERDGLDADLPGVFSYEEWEVLESRVDLENGFVEADTGSFSSFGLFEAEKSTGVADNPFPDTFYLGQNRPNPFNPTTTIQFSVPSSGNVWLTVYNSAGQKVATLVDGNFLPGKHQAIFDGSGFASGVYFYRITGSGFAATKRMLLIK